ncbi:MAG: 1-(5-phosphoribosyl)-5-[(5-phosphoribosylamino)methylideneamino] imidazole-4-carboxamide isomerase [Gaiellaceae bacterium]|jgi:phosphoribosylformimino-5-aminoimidazole carboxamide ribotide isomerase
MPFIVYPAIDVLEGRCVRLAEGRREQVTIEGGDPVAAARRFVEEGARFLHMVDLDGAFSGQPSLDLVRRVVEAAPGVPLQVGGGYRSRELIEAALAAGVARVMVGTAAASPEFLANAAADFGEGLIVAIDVRDGKVALRGWTERSELDAIDLGRACAAAGVRRLLLTSTRRDGSLAGPDLELVRSLREAIDLPLIAAGGVATLDDLRALRDSGCEGAIAGSAIWTGRFTLADAERALAAQAADESP